MYIHSGWSVVEACGYSCTLLVVINCGWVYTQPPLVTQAHGLCTPSGFIALRSFMAISTPSCCTCAVCMYFWSMPITSIIHWSLSLPPSPSPSPPPLSAEFSPNSVWHNSQGHLCWRPQGLSMSLCQSCLTRIHVTLEVNSCHESQILF